MKSCIKDANIKNTGIRNTSTFKPLEINFAVS